jgi:HD-like signal output (HDOD) protein
MSFIDAALPHTQDWIRHFERAGIPVLARTRDALAALNEKIDNIAPRDISAVVIDDPLMSLKVLVWAGKQLARNVRISRSTLGNEIETVETAIVSTGIAPFFRQFAKLDTVEARLADSPGAQLGLDRVLSRSLNAADFARDWASYRNDFDIQIISEAAMLHDVAEMLVWVFAPTLSLKMQALQVSSPRTRSHEIQESCLGVTLNHLEVAIMKEWRLSSLLRRLIDDSQASDSQRDAAQVKNAVLAANLARHLANSRDDPALPDDFVAIAELLRTTPEWVRTRVMSADENEIDQRDDH